MHNNTVCDSYCVINVTIVYTVLSCFYKAQLSRNIFLSVSQAKRTIIRLCLLHHMSEHAFFCCSVCANPLLRLQPVSELVTSLLANLWTNDNLGFVAGITNRIGQIPLALWLEWLGATTYNYWVICLFEIYFLCRSAGRLLIQHGEILLYNGVPNYDLSIGIMK